MDLRAQRADGGFKTSFARGQRGQSFGGPWTRRYAFMSMSVSC